MLASMGVSGIARRQGVMLCRGLASAPAKKPPAAAPSTPAKATPAAPKGGATGGKDGPTASTGKMALPTRVTGLEGRYAGAVFCAAHAANQVANVEKDLASFLATAQVSKDLAELIKNPSIPRRIKGEAMTAISKKLGVCSTTAKMLQLLCENGRIDMVGKIAGKFSLIMSASRGEVPALVTSADPLSAEQMASLAAALNKFVSKGEKVVLSTKVDESILGGLVVDVGDKHIDMSVASRINRLQTLLNAAV